MNRREAIGLGAAAFAAGALRPLLAAQTPAGKIHLDAYSRTLHWLRTPAEVAEACHEIGNTTIDLTVRTYPGHVDPAKVATDLPPFVKGLRDNGVTVSCMAAEIADANTPNVAAMLETASANGIHHTWWRGLTVDPKLAYPQQLESLKPRVAGLSALCEKYGVKAMYHPGGGFSGAFFDILELCRMFDPRFISIQYDTGNLQQFSQTILASQLRIGGPYIGGFVWKDFVIEKAAPGEPPPAAAPYPRDMAPPAGAAAGAERGGRAGGPPGNGAVNGWRSRQVPIGTGVVNIKLASEALKEIGFDGPMECQPEWPELGGPNQGLEKLSIPREQVISLLRRDYTTVTAALTNAGLT
jgi:sugar phosphate isomerase/epimerase